MNIHTRLIGGPADNQACIVDTDRYTFEVPVDDDEYYIVHAYTRRVIILPDRWDNKIFVYAHNSLTDEEALDIWRNR